MDNECNNMPERHMMCLLAKMMEITQVSAEMDIRETLQGKCYQLNSVRQCSSIADHHNNKSISYIFKHSILLQCVSYKAEAAVSNSQISTKISIMYHTAFLNKSPL